MEEYEYHEIVDSSGVKAYTDRLYLLQIQKDKNTIERIDTILDSSNLADLYLLINSQTCQTYVGESSDIKDRIQQHVKKSPVDSLEFDKIIIIWDGRPITTSRFSEETLRKSLEKDCINVLVPQFSKHISVNTVKKPKETSLTNKSSSSRLKEELYLLLYKIHLLHTMPSKVIR